MKKIIFKYLILLLCVHVQNSYANLDAIITKPTIHLGILAYRPKEQIIQAYSPLQAYLNRTIPEYEFHIHVLDYIEIEEYVKEKKIDFVFTNPGNYILLKEKFDLSSPLATLAVKENGKKTTHFGGVVFTNASSSIQTLKDLKGKTIATPHLESLGAYQMQALELLKFDIDPKQDVKFVVTNMPHDKVVYAVLNHEADAGFVRTGLLEKMVQEGKLRFEQIRLLNEQHYTPEFPVKVSTALYPEWPMAALSHVDERIARKVLAALFMIPDESEIVNALEIYGFNVPQDYSSVEQLLRTLKFAPFDEIPNFSLKDIWLRYHDIVSIVSSILMLIFLIVIYFLIRLNRLVQNNYFKEHYLTNRLQRFAQIIEQSPISIMVTTVEGSITYVNKRFTQMTGFTKDEAIGKNPSILKSDRTSTELYTQLWKQLKDKEIWEGEIINKTKDHQEYIEWATIAPLYQDDGQVTHYVAMKEDITKRKKNEELIQNLAYYDQLTLLPNRQKLHLDIIDSSPVGCIVFNIDDFKEINDFFGLEAGDKILKQVGLWFKELGFKTYRTGGDEFTVLLYDTQVTADILKHRLSIFSHTLEEKEFQIAQEDIALRMSAGVAFGKENLLIHADIALHTAKEKKMNYYIYQEAENLEEHYHKNLNMAEQIRKAIVQGRIICYYQPIVDSNTHSIIKYETLVRMIDEGGHIITPNEFLPIAQKMKIYSRITQEVIYQACHLFKESSIEFSVNLSIQDIEDEHTMYAILKTIHETKTAHQIVFEIVESHGIDNYDNVQNFISKVKSLGSKIAVDDFGVGYANFSHILQMNVDYIKIDGSLIQDIVNNPKNIILIQSIIEFAHQLNIKTIAEFVSSEEIYHKVKSLGIDYLQGYYIGKPTALTILG